MDDFARLQEYTPMIGIAHHIPGRIRLKLNDRDSTMKQVAAHAKHFSNIWQDVPGIRSVRINPLARSCTVEYDENLIPFHVWPDLLDGIRSNEALDLLAVFRKKYDELLRG